VSKQRAALEHLIERCRQADPNCGVLLQGSVARGDERPESDIDLTVVLSISEPLAYNEVIARENRYGMIRIHLDEWDVDVDVNWLTADELLEIVRTRGATDWWMFYRGAAVHDPAGHAGRCHEAISNWFDRNPNVADAWSLQQAEVEKRKLDPGHPIRFETQPAFCAHLREIAKEERRA
jgi:predicted nucleotidyltransferase